VLFPTGFGYANQRIVREVRTDTFASLLKQDIAFFDSHTSGELASRLNSDCGEMAGDLVSHMLWRILLKLCIAFLCIFQTWFFRFSIESVVRITGITAYMLLRSPKLGACALSILPLVAIINKFYGDWLRVSNVAGEWRDAFQQKKFDSSHAWSGHLVRKMLRLSKTLLQQQTLLRKRHWHASEQ
jgi:ABC-type multidrug transport system fused ATPase/permease subunit